MEQKNIITTKDLAIGYSASKKNLVLLEQINISIPKGKLTAIIGLNGAGKSTLIKTLALQQPKLKGSIYIENKETSSFTNLEWSKKVAWVQANYEANLNITVLEYISLGRQPYTNWIDKLTNTDIKIINTVINETGLDDLRNKPCNQLSDGQMQRVSIARALAQDTEIIILDEPTTHLDITNKISTLNLLKKLCFTQNKTILFTTHEIEFALQVSDYVLGISKNAVSINTTENCIRKGVINKLFDTSSLFFDIKKRGFVIKQTIQ